MDTIRPKTLAEFTVEVIRAMLRALPEVTRAEVLRAVISSPSQGDEKRSIDDALTASGDSVTGAAQVLGVSRRTLMVRMRELGYPPRTGGGKRKALA
jgi:transcriptional regulator with PAS, ATPase and Fis domain